MATFETTLTIKIRAYSGASEADMSDYGAGLVQDVKQKVESMRFDSWRQELYTDWDQSEKVDLMISVS